MSWYDAKPWEAHYDALMRDFRAETTTITALFDAAVQTNPHGVAIRYFEDELTYRDVDTLTDGIAQYLVDSGFAVGDRLAIFLQSIPQFVLSAVAAWKSGGIVVPLNPMYSTRELADALAATGARALVFAERQWAHSVEQALRRVQVPIVLSTSELDFHDQRRRVPPTLAAIERCPIRGVADLLDVARRRSGGRRSSVPTDPADVALISFTSGTSGAPKGALNTHANLAFSARRLIGSVDVPRHPVIFALAPLFHITGMVAELAATLASAGTLILTCRFEASTAIDMIRRHRPHYMVGPPTAYIALLSVPGVTRDDFGSFEALFSGGAPLPAALLTELSERCGTYLRNGYGLTETTAGCVTVPSGVSAPVDPETGVVAVGLPVPGADVRIVDDHMRELPPGTFGEIVVAGPMVVPGHWDNADADAASFHSGRFRTGDIGFMDGQGWVYVVDRKKDIIIASGFKVMPTEVEEVLYAHPAVREAAVVGVPDAYRGETVEAFVSLRVDVEVPELDAHCRSNLAAYKTPRRIHLMAELPKTTSGKILRRELRSRRRDELINPT
ncbi:long-chain fatty acid--CoA ligase [Gordonia sp. TBRC 11910]|uniref:Long-chain fatty acid--CoA ligase n=1 Tax=Gordonia asplenii TaxID=2725283 RepID=A0A848KVQ1_9ACTN|nr:AMP-binding protein [Gordonia asplenii]NMO02934.1 long-chain fatty acid--CoA ligase [Gordonia asplenii]